MSGMRNTAGQYGLVAQFFHWSIVVLILTQYLWAWRIDQEGAVSRARLELVTQHKTIGMIILALAVARLAWRLFDRPPRLPDSVAGWERGAAAATHWLLYGLILAMPLTGWLYSSAAGFGDQWWGPVNFPALMGSSDYWQDVLGAVHGWLAVALAALAGLHVLAALRHHFILRDAVLSRMLPTRRPRG